MVGRLNTDAFPALRAAVASYNERHREGVRHHTSTQTLHTFGGCVYTLRFTVDEKVHPSTGKQSSDEQKSQRSPLSAKSESDSSSESDFTPPWRRPPLHEGNVSEVQLSSSSNTLSADVQNGIACEATIHLSFAHAIAPDQLDQFQNFHEEVQSSLERAAPHCRCTTTESTSDVVGVVIPADVSVSERCAALKWAAQLRVSALLPVVHGLAHRCRESENRQSLALLPQKIAATTVYDIATAETEADAQWTEALFVVATPSPSISAPSSARRSGDTAEVGFDGTLTFTSCITAENARDAVWVRRYLEAFSEAATATANTVLLLHESPQPPHELKLPQVRKDDVVSSPFVWWCTMLAGPSQLRSEEGLIRALRWSLCLRQTVLFHVHQEHLAVNSLLRQQLSTYAAQFQ